MLRSRRPARTRCSLPARRQRPHPCCSPTRVVAVLLVAPGRRRPARAAAAGAAATDPQQGPQGDLQRRQEGQERQGRAQARGSTRRAPRLGGPVAITLTGPFQSQGTRAAAEFDFALTLSAPGQHVHRRRRLDRRPGLPQGPEQRLRGPAAGLRPVQAGLRASAGPADGIEARTRRSPSLGVEPENWLKDPKIEGDDRRRRDEDDHIAAGVDVPALLDGVSRLLSKAGALGGTQTRSCRPRSPPSSGSGRGRDQGREVDVCTGKDDKTCAADVELKIDVPRPRSSGPRPEGARHARPHAGRPQRAADDHAPANPSRSPSYRALAALGGARGASGGGRRLGRHGLDAAAPAPARGSQRAKVAGLRGVPAQAGGDIAKAQKCASCSDRRLAPAR